LRNRQLADLKFRRQHQIGNYIVDFFCAEHNLVVELDGNVHDSPDRRKIDAKRDAYLRSLGHTVVRFPNARVFEDTQRVLQEIIEAVPETRKSGSPRPLGEGQGEGPKDGEGLPGNMTSDHRGARYRDTVLFVDARHIYRQIDRAHRDWTESQISFLANIVRLYRGEDLDFTLGGDEAKDKIQQIFAAQPSLDASRHPLPVGEDKKAPNTPPRPLGEGRGEGTPALMRYRDIPGLCRVATIAEIAQQAWSLNPGRYVGVAPGESVSDEDFKEQLETLNEELEILNAQARELEQTIAGNVAQILET